MESSALRRSLEHDFHLQWGNRKRMRCVKMQVKSGMSGTDVKIKRTAFRVEKPVFIAEPEAPQPPRTPPPPNQAFIRASNSQPPTVKSIAAESVRMKSTVIHYWPEKSVRVHRPRHHSSNQRESSSTEETNKISMDADVIQEKASNLEDFVWPKIVVPLTSKEKEEDYMAIKGCKLTQRPKKRAKFIQKNLLVSTLNFLVRF